MDEEELGAVTAPAYVRSPGKQRILEPFAGVAGGACCDVCGNPKTAAYHHPNRLRRTVVLYRCHYHRFVTSVRDNPKAAPGGGVYR